MFQIFIAAYRLALVQIISSTGHSCVRQTHIRIQYEQAHTINIVNKSVNKVHFCTVCTVGIHFSCVVSIWATPQGRYIISPAYPGSTMRSAPRWTCPKHFPSVTILTRSLNPPQLAPLEVEEQCFLILSLTLSPDTLLKKLFLTVCIRGHHTDLTTIGEGWNVARLVN